MCTSPLFFLFFFFFNLISPSPFLTCPQRHVCQSTMHSQSIPLMYSMHETRVPNGRGGVIECAHQRSSDVGQSWVRRQLGSTSWSSGRKISVRWFTRLGVTPRALWLHPSSTQIILSPQDWHASRGGSYLEGSYASPSPLTFSQTKLFIAQIQSVPWIYFMGIKKTFIFFF